jgi:hypothetical protein
VGSVHLLTVSPHGEPMEIVMTEPQPVVIVEPPVPIGYVHPDAPDGFPTPGHKMAAEEAEVPVDHLGRITELARELKNASPSGAETIAGKILFHAGALANPDREKARVENEKKASEAQNKQLMDAQNPDKAEADEKVTQDKADEAKRLADAQAKMNKPQVMA